MLIEPVSQKQPVTIMPSLMGGPNEQTGPVSKPDGKSVNAGDGVDERLKDAYWGDNNYL